MIEDEDIGALADSDARSVGGADPFSGEIGALRILRDGDVAAHSDGADAAALDDYDRMFNRLSAGRDYGSGADEDLHIRSLARTEDKKRGDSEQRLHLRKSQYRTLRYACAVSMTRRKWIAGGIAAGLARAAGRAYKKGVCSVAFAPRTGVDEMFRMAKQADFDSIELRLDVDLTESGDVKRRAADHGVEIASLWASQPLSKYPLNSPDAGTRAKGVESIIRATDVAAGIGCGAVLLVPGRVGNGAKLFDGYEDTWKRFTEELQKCVSASENNRVLLTIENVWNKFLLSPLEMRTFVDQFRSPWIQAHFDMGNVMPWGYPEDWIHTLGPRIRRVHVKDYKLQTGREPGRFVPLLEGDVNYAAVMAALRDVKYEGFLSAEIEYAGPETVQQVSAQMDRILNL